MYIFFRFPGGIKEVVNPPFLRQDLSSSSASVLSPHRQNDMFMIYMHMQHTRLHARTHTHQKYGKIREDSEITTDTCHSLSRVPRFSYLVSDNPCFFFLSLFNFCPPNCSRFATGVNKRSQDSHTNRCTLWISLKWEI